MKKKREPLRLIGASIFKDGKSLNIDPKNDPATANQCAAIIKTLETGIQHTVIA